MVTLNQRVNNQGSSVGCGEVRTASFVKPGQTHAKLHNASDYANKPRPPSAPFVRIICTMQNAACFARVHLASKIEASRYKLG
jgi:hypothetical protein